MAKTITLFVMTTLILASTAGGVWFAETNPVIAQGMWGMAAALMAVFIAEMLK